MGACCSDISGGMEAIGGLDGEDAATGAELLLNTHALTSEVQLWLSASNLRDRDVFSKSDPMAVLYAKRDGSLEEIGRTEVVLNTLDPAWVTSITVAYNFDELQQLVFRVYDVDSKFSGIRPQDLQLKEQEFLGETTCILAEVVAAPEQCLSRTLETQGGSDSRIKSLGTLTIKCEEVLHSKSVVEMVLRCSNLINMDLFSKSDPFLRISRSREDGSVVPVYQTEVKRNNLHPTWKGIKVTLQQLCNGDMERPLKIECFNFNSSGRHDLIGSLQVSANDLQAAVERSMSMELKRPNDASKAGGILQVESCLISAGYSFLDYIRGGCQLNFMVAVDFTASNGHPSQHDSLHYMDPSGKPNPYEVAIEAVGEVLEYYDSDKRFPAWGFGGRPIDGPVSHCFNLNGHSTVSEVDGVDGILRAYSQALKHVALAGPTLFAPVINKAASIASEHASQGWQKYFVLLIITDGVIIDLHQTINAIVEASSFPLSIIIIGVGGADFTEMEILDADKRKLVSSDGRFADRDIVQFVPFRSLTSKSNLRKVVLGELPTQLLQYMKIRGIVPNRL